MKKVIWFFMCLFLFSSHAHSYVKIPRWLKNTLSPNESLASLETSCTKIFLANFSNMIRPNSIGGSGVQMQKYKVPSPIRSLLGYAVGKLDGHRQSRRQRTQNFLLAAAYYEYVTSSGLTPDQLQMMKTIVYIDQMTTIRGEDLALGNRDSYKFQIDNPFCEFRMMSSFSYQMRPTRYSSIEQIQRSIRSVISEIEDISAQSIDQLVEDFHFTAITRNRRKISRIVATRSINIEIPEKGDHGYSLLEELYTSLPY